MSHYCGSQNKFLCIKLKVETLQASSNFSQKSADTVNITRTKEEIHFAQEIYRYWGKHAILEFKIYRHLVQSQIAHNYSIALQLQALHK